MTITFPDPRQKDEDGIVYIGGNINAVNLRAAYKKGIFPWPVHPDPYPVLWFSPDPRGVLFLQDFHISKSLKKLIKKNPFQITMNKKFREVMNLCKDNRNRRGSTWITDELISGYSELFEEGQAYSIEIWKDGALTGGLYGVCMGGYYSAESMFFLESGASKIAIVHLYEHLQALDVKWLDIQMVTPITASFGGVEISQEEYLKLLEKAF